MGLEIYNTPVQKKKRHFPELADWKAFLAHSRVAKYEGRLTSKTPCVVFGFSSFSIGLVLGLAAEKVQKCGSFETQDCQQSQHLRPRIDTAGRFRRTILLNNSHMICEPAQTEHRILSLCERLPQRN